MNLEKCLCTNASTKQRCTYKTKPQSDFCGIHKNCKDKVQRPPSPPQRQPSPLQRQPSPLQRPPSPQINRKEKICLCMNQSKGKRCENKAKPGLDFCGVHRKCKNMI